MAQGKFFAALLGSLLLASPALAQRADLPMQDRPPGDRTTLVSSTEWALQSGESELPETSHPELDQPGFTATVRYAPPRVVDSLTASRGEVNWNVGGDNVLFGRVEKLTRDEVLSDRDAPIHERAFRVTKLQAGYARHVDVAEDLKLTVGGSAAAFDTPDLLEESYGDDRIGYTVFARLKLSR
jgi:hypothetical protein